MHIVGTVLNFIFFVCAFATEPGSEYRIGAGDKVEIIIHGEEDHFRATEYVVGGDGNVSFPYVGKVQVKGMSAYEAERAIHDRLRDGFIHEPQVTVHINAFNSQNVDVIGAVKAPGVYGLEGTTTLRGLLAKAGSVDASRSNGFVVIRRGEETTRHSVKELEGAAGSFILRGGDVVDVEQGSNIFLAGEVVTPGAIPFVEGVSASQALLMAGGSSDFARLSGAYVVRGSERIDVNLKRVLKGREADIPLQPGDRLVIPISPL